MKWATFTDAVPGVDVTVGHYQPRGLVSWTRSVDPYTFYVPQIVTQITIAAEREPFEIDQFDRVQTLLRSYKGNCLARSPMKYEKKSLKKSTPHFCVAGRRSIAMLRHLNPVSHM